MSPRTPSDTFSPVVTRVRSTRPTAGQPVCAFTVDVEDWYQSCVDVDAPITARVVRNVERVLHVLDQFRVKATFFVQGRVAEAFPRLLQDLVAEGHEIQSHGYSHRPLFRMTDKELRDELKRAKGSVEEAAGTRVTAFRAQDFSVLAENLWALETIADVGFEVDSSIFPMRARHYGIAGWPLGPHHVEFGDGSKILEIPVAVWEGGGLRVPVAGGGYFRLLPRALLESCLRSITASGRPAIVYCHPYEFNPTELDDYRHDVPRLLRLTQALGRRPFGHRVHRLLTELSFDRLDHVLRAWGLA